MREHEPAKCKRCGGTGEEADYVEIGGAMVPIPSGCQACNATGYVSGIQKPVFPQETGTALPFAWTSEEEINLIGELGGASMYAISAPLNEMQVPLYLSPPKLTKDQQTSVPEGWSFRRTPLDNSGRFGFIISKDGEVRASTAIFHDEEGLIEQFLFALLTAHEKA